MSTIDKAVGGLGKARRTVNEAVFETTIRLGVTGLSRAGKTVFITSLVENLLQPDRMVQFKPHAQGRIEAAYLQPQPDRTVPRFQFEQHLTALTNSSPIWPESTRSISQLRLSLRMQPIGLIGGLSGPRMVHLDIVDYPGEWLLDLPLIGLSYSEWSEASLNAMSQRQDVASEFLHQIEQADISSAFNEQLAEDLSISFTNYLRASREQGYSALAPGRFLMPGDLDGAPVMMFAPLPRCTGRQSAFYEEMEKRFEAYKSKVVLPFFRDHFSKLDRQIVLMDVLGALDAGPAALVDLQKAMVEILECFKVGENSFLSRLFTRRIDRLLFAATKSDHIHHNQHPALDSLVQSMVRKAKDRAQFKGAHTRSMALASLRTTAESVRSVDGTKLDMVEGRLESSGSLGASFPGTIPNDPAQILGDASQNGTWSDWSFALERFLPASKRNGTVAGLPHIRLDEAAEFLLGDKL